MEAVDCRPPGAFLSAGGSKDDLTTKGSWRAHNLNGENRSITAHHFLCLEKKNSQCALVCSSYIMAQRQNNVHLVERKVINLYVFSSCSMAGAYTDAYGREDKLGYLQIRLSLKEKAMDGGNM